MRRKTFVGEQQPSSPPDPTPNGYSRQGSRDPPKIRTAQKAAHTCAWVPAKTPREAGRESLRLRDWVGDWERSLEEERGTRKGASTVAVFHLFFSFFFCSFSKNVTIKIQKIKSLLGPEPLNPQPRPPPKGPMDGGGGKGEKKKRENSPLFHFLFSHEGQESLERRRRRWAVGSRGGGAGRATGEGAGTQVGSPHGSHPPEAGRRAGSSPGVPEQPQQALLAA